jgi:restriction endonuclease S subunit
VGQQRVPVNFLGNLEIPVPESLEKQRQIVTKLKAQLTEVETVRNAAKAQLADIKALPARLLKQAFTSLT